MEFTCHTKYDQQALTAMARAVRKTVRAKRSRMVRIWARIIIALLAVSSGSPGGMSGRWRQTAS